MTQLSFVEAVWNFSVFVFLAVTFYLHFILKPFNPYVLFDRNSEDFRYNLATLIVAVTIQISGFHLFSELPRL